MLIPRISKALIIPQNMEKQEAPIMSGGAIEPVKYSSAGDVGDF